MLFLCWWIFIKQICCLRLVMILIRSQMERLSMYVHRTVRVCIMMPSTYNFMLFKSIKYVSARKMWWWNFQRHHNSQKREILQNVYIWDILGYLEPHKVFWIIHVSDLWHSLWYIEMWYKRCIEKHEILMLFQFKVSFSTQGNKRTGRRRGTPLWERKKFLTIECFVITGESLYILLHSTQTFQIVQISNPELFLTLHAQSNFLPKKYRNTLKKSWKHMKNTARVIENLIWISASQKVPDYIHTSIHQVSIY